MKEGEGGGREGKGERWGGGRGGNRHVYMYIDI